MPWETRNERIDRELRTVDEDTIDAVRQYLKEGRSADEIRKILREGPKFTDEQINEILEKASKEPQPETDTSAGSNTPADTFYAILQVVVGLLFGSVGAYIVFRGNAPKFFLLFVFLGVLLVANGLGTYSGGRLSRKLIGIAISGLFFFAAYWTFTHPSDVTGSLSWLFSSLIPGHEALFQRASAYILALLFIFIGILPHIPSGWSWTMHPPR